MENLITGITHMGIRCSDFERSCSFYKEIMGFEEVFSIEKEDHPWLIYLRVSGHQFVELFSGEYEEQMGQGIPAAHVCFLTEDIEALARHFREKGLILYRGPSYKNRPREIPDTFQPASCGSYTFYVKDPDGNELEFMQFTDISKQLKE